MQQHKEVIKKLVTNVLDSSYESVQQDNFSDINDIDRKEMDDNDTKLSDLEQILLAMLPEEGRKVYRELEETMVSNLCIQSRYMYKKGVIDGLTKLEYLKEASNCVYLPLIKL